MKNPKPKLMFFLILSTVLRSGAAQESPNIVTILAADFGYGSPNCYGTDVRHIRTPNVDWFAKEGVTFTQAYTPGSVCTPTHYALPTGLLPNRLFRTSMRL